MPIKWKQSPRFKPELLLKEISKARRIQPNGRVSFVMPDVFDSELAILSMLSFPGGLTGVARHGLVLEASSRVQGEITKDSFLREINRAAKTRLAIKENIYHVLTSISIACTALPKRIIRDRSEVCFLRGAHPKRYSARSGLVKSAIETRKLESTPSSYTPVIVKLKAKSPQQATTDALHILDVYRASWCLLANSDMQIIGPNWHPINVVRLGSVHTVHMPNGRLATETFWFEPNFVPVPNPFVPEKPKTFQRSLRRISNGLRLSRHSARLIEALVRYVRALDECDPDTAFLRLWRALESIAVPNQADYEKLVKRCSFLFADSPLYAQMLEHLREYRNLSVHAGDQSESARQNCYLLQRFFRQLIIFHISWAAFFENLDELNSFLELPPNAETLRRRQHILAKAFKYIRPIGNS